MTQIDLNVISSCAYDVELGWTIFTTNYELLPLSNCSLVSLLDEKPVVENWFPLLKNQGTFKLEKKLLDGVNYKFRLICGWSRSNFVSLTALGKHIKVPFKILKALKCVYFIPLQRCYDCFTTKLANYIITERL